MRAPRTTGFDEERERFELRFCCDECGHFDREQTRCRHDWPTALHRLEHYRDETTREIVFCKEFELW